MTAMRVLPPRGGGFLWFATSAATIYAVEWSRQTPKLLIYIWWKIWVRLLPLPPQSDAASVNLLPVHY